MKRRCELCLVCVYSHHNAASSHNQQGIETKKSPLLGARVALAGHFRERRLSQIKYTTITTLIFEQFLQGTQTSRRESKYPTVVSQTAGQTNRDSKIDCSTWREAEPLYYRRPARIGCIEVCLQPDSFKGPCEVLSEVKRNNFLALVATVSPASEHQLTYLLGSFNPFCIYST